MPTFAPSIRTLILRSTTASLRPTSSQIHPQIFPQLNNRRSASPPPPYQARNHSILASTTQWTRFTTPYTLSSVRTFTSSPATRTSASPPTPPQSSPQAAQKIEDAIEKIQDLYGTARDEFEIAAEETEKNSTYAEDDRAAAREELDVLLEFYGGIVEGEDRAVAEEVTRRVGQRIRELEQAVIALEESVMHGD